MPEAKPKVTLIGRLLARPGLEFIFEGELPECEHCRVRKACNNLQSGRKYRIVSVRTAAPHDCSIHDGGTCAVEVIESPIVALVNADMAIMNSRITFEFSCNKEECKSFELCRPDGVVDGDRYLVGEILGNAPDICEKGRALKLVELRPL
ncbi:MAG TPA: UPF0179 family protein [Methanomicrobiales archaeon]|jgi:uncharacterized protein (UPF0179 family)|nr:UPF0179 family protein [Methanomicrobiales archaeon]